MKAIVHTAYGPSNELELQEVAKPLPGDKEILIKVRATTVTTSDCNMRNLTFVPKLLWLPMRLEFGLTKP
jgi:NADPH:quinone reductase-like Zn-dependent oxidoreductase